MRLYAYPNATAPGRELALAAEAMLPEAKREAFLAAFDGGRMRPASLGRVEAETFAQRSVPPDLAEASGRIASLAGKFEDVKGSTSTLAQAMLERASGRATAGGGEVSPSVRRIASDLRHLSGRAEDHRDGACAQFLIDKALSSGDHEGAMKFLRAFQFGQLASGREIAQEKGRHADFSR